MRDRVIVVARESRQFVADHCPDEHGAKNDPNIDKKPADDRGNESNSPRNAGVFQLFALNFAQFAHRLRPAGVLDDFLFVAVLALS